MAAQATGALITTPNFEQAADLLRVHPAPPSKPLRRIFTVLVSVWNSDLPLAECCAADLEVPAAQHVSILSVHCPTSLPDS